MAPRFSVGELVWAHTGTDACFQKGTVERLDAHKGTINVRLAKGSVDVKDTDVHKTNAEVQDGLPDNTYLRELNEATLLHNVHTRYSDKDDGGCYSVTGHILIAVNPFRPLSIYETANVSAFATHCARCAAAAAAKAAVASTLSYARRWFANQSTHHPPVLRPLVASAPSPLLYACTIHSASCHRRSRPFAVVVASSSLRLAAQAVSGAAHRCAATAHLRCG